MPTWSPRRRTDMWKRLHYELWRLWRRSQRGRDERRAARARARFWADLREGQREAADHSRRSAVEARRPSRV